MPTKVTVTALCYESQNDLKHETAAHSLLCVLRLKSAKQRHSPQLSIIRMKRMILLNTGKDQNSKQTCHEKSSQKQTRYQHRSTNSSRNSLDCEIMTESRQHFYHKTSPTVK